MTNKVSSGDVFDNRGLIEGIESEFPSLDEMGREENSDLENKVADVFEQFLPVIERLYENLGDVKSSINATNNPDELRKILVVVDRLLMKLENVDMDEIQDESSLEGYINVLDVCLEINDLIEEKRSGLLPNINDVRPQLVQRSDGKIGVIRAAPQIKNLILPGGGAKGIGLGPALAELVRAGALENLERIVGSSTGALAGMYFASGVSPDQIIEFVDAHGAKDVMGDCKDSEKKYPGLHLSGMGLSATKVVELTDKTTSESVKKFLVENWNNEKFQEKLGELKRESEGVVERLDLLKQGSDNQDDRTPHMITFKDLSILHLLDPGKFKELTITGWDATKEEKFYFNSETTPNMPVAYAGRVSMGIPKAFKSVKMDPDGDGVRRFVDGGIGSNVPAEAVLLKDEMQDEKEVEELRASTLLLVFDGGGKAYRKMHAEDENPNIIEVFLKSLAGKYLLENPEYNRTSEEDGQKIREAGPNAFVISHGDIGMMDFRASPKRREKAKEAAAEKAREQIAFRKEQAFYQQYDSVEEIYSRLTPEEKQAIHDLPAPFSNDPENVKFKLELELYRLVMEGFESN